MKQTAYPLYETTVFENFRVLTENAAQRTPDRPAISYRANPHDKEPTVKTFENLRCDQRDLGTELHRRGFDNRHTAIIGESSYPWVLSYFTLMAVGAVTVPLDKELPVADLSATLISAGATAVFYSAAVDAKMPDIRRALPPDTLYVRLTLDPGTPDSPTLGDLVSLGHRRFEDGDTVYYDYGIDADRLASIVFTSGTTGKGKGVMLSQHNIVSDMTQGMYLFDITRDRQTLVALPPHHTFCSTVLFTGHLAQSAGLYISGGLRYIMKELSEVKPEHLVLVPLFVESFYKRIWSAARKSGKEGALKALIRMSNGLRKIGIDRRDSLFRSVRENFGGNLHMIICGGAALNQDIIDFFDAIGITILNGYGITECAPLISCNRNKLQKKGSVGTPIIGEQVKIANPDENGEGEICVKGPNVMLGYYQNPAATRAAFDEDGYFRTGDYGKLDSEGWLYITGRLKNLIIFSNGKNVYPEEIETEISRIRGVGEVVVYAGESISDPRREAIVAEIYPDADALEGVTDYQSYFEAKIAEINARSVSYKRVDVVKIRPEEFVKNTSKKIIRVAIDKTIA